MTDSEFVVNGVPMRCPAWNLWTSAGLYQTPEIRGDDIVIPSMHGAFNPESVQLAPRRRYGSGKIEFNLQVLGVSQATGMQPDSDEASRQLVLQNTTTLVRLFSARTLTIEHLRADGDRIAVARLAAPIVLDDRPGSPWYGQIKVTCAIPGAFWRSRDTVTVGTPSSGVPAGTAFSLDAFASEAPITDLEVRFAGVSGATGVNPFIGVQEMYLGYLGTVPANAELLVQGIANRGIAGAGSPWTPNLGLITYNPGPTFVSIDPTVTGQSMYFNHSSSLMRCSISGYPKWLTA